MKKKPANDFYLKVCIWTFFCLVLAGICSQIKAVIISSTTTARESSTTQTIQVIRTMQTQYYQKYAGKYAPNFDELIKAENLDEKFAGEYPTVNGYTFLIKVEDPSAIKPAFYSINADPLFCDCEQMHFYFDSTLGTIKHTEENRPARADDPSF